MTSVPVRRVIPHLALLALFSIAMSLRIASAQTVPSRIHAADNMPLVLIPAGTFEMGCSADEEPCPEGDTLQTVAIAQPIWMAAHEVTLRQFAAFVDATGYRTDAEETGSHRTWRAAGFDQQLEDPVVYVSWNDAAAYAEWVGGRLPTEPEWEYASRAGSRTRYFWGDQMEGAYAWYRENARDHPNPVATRMPNRWGLYDVIGNVWEWCDAEEGRSYAREGGTSATNATFRGGSWATCPWLMRASLAHRYLATWDPAWSSDDTGFRYVLED